MLTGWGNVATDVSAPGSPYMVPESDTGTRYVKEIQHHVNYQEDTVILWVDVLHC